MTSERRQLDAIADALLAPGLQAQRERAARLRLRRKRQRNLSGAGAILGVWVGGLIGHAVSGHLFPGNVIGVFVGGLAGHLLAAIRPAGE